MQTYVLELSLEHERFPYEELESVSRRLCDDLERIDRRICLLRRRGDGDASAYSNALAFTLSISRLHGAYDDWESLRNGVGELGRTLRGRTACIRFSSRGGTGRKKQDTERELGEILAASCPIRLESPEFEARVTAAGGKYLLSLKVADIDRRALDSRQAKFRAFFSPISLSPRYARGLLNMCDVSAGMRVLDPFCGTGGIVMEAVLLGARAVGSDIDGKMVEGTEANLRQLHLESGWELHRMDVGEIGTLGQFDAVVTDPPYGRSSFYNREDIAALYSRFVEAAAPCLREGGCLGVVVPDASMLPSVSGMTVERHLQQRVHKSLVRNYMVLRKRAG